MKLALWQTAPPAGAWPDLLQILADTLAAARAQDADLLLCPELFTSGYNAPEVILARAEPQEGPLGAQIGALAARAGMAVAYGYPEQPAPGGPVYNAARLVGPDGTTRLNYRKTHLYGAQERAVFAPGETLGAPVTLGGWRIGVLICFDVEFPETVRSLALAGAELVLVPTALPAGGEAVPRHLIPARAAENGVFIAYADYCGSARGLTYAGLSCMAGPNGDMLAQLGGAPGMAIVALTHDAITSARRGHRLSGRTPAKSLPAVSCPPSCAKVFCFFFSKKKKPKPQRKSVLS